MLKKIAKSLLLAAVVAQFFVCGSIASDDEYPDEFEMRLTKKNGDYYYMHVDRSGPRNKITFMDEETRNKKYKTQFIQSLTDMSQWVLILAAGWIGWTRYLTGRWFG